ncbi:MAG: molybdate ABC transporter substrate-binding protein [Gordonia sp. (in: high G+C Gram-positive bacteria)]
MRSRKMFRFSIVIAAIVAMIVAMTGCSSDDEKKTLRVMAAASLVDVMKTFTTQYEKDHPDTTVETDTAASSELIQRLKSGAKADVLITADAKSMDGAVKDGLVKNPTVVAGNKLVIVVPKGNPGKVTGLDFFTKAGNRSVICASEVPCGRAAEQAIAKAGGEPHPISRAENVRSALGSVTSGEADAALVYATDAASAGDRVETIQLPDATITQIPAAAVTGDGDAFVELLKSEQGQKIFQEAGFGRP